MKIYNSYIYNNIGYNPKFGDTAMQSNTKYAAERLTHYTLVGRDLNLLDRSKIANYIIDLTNKEQNPIKILFCGCSDGSEPFDFTIAVYDKFKKNNIPESEFPKIYAFDKQEKLVNTAKLGIINIDIRSLKWLQDKYDKTYFTPCNGLYFSRNENISALKELGFIFKCSQQLDKDVLSKINFYISDIITELNNLKAEKSPIVVFCRNLAQYNSEEDQITIAKLLNEKLSKDSIVIVGFGDIHYTTNKKGYSGMSNEELFGLKPLKLVETLTQLNFKACKDLCSTGIIFKKF